MARKCRPPAGGFLWRCQARHFSRGKPMLAWRSGAECCTASCPRTSRTWPGCAGDLYCRRVCPRRPRRAVPECHATGTMNSAIRFSACTEATLVPAGRVAAQSTSETFIGRGIRATRVEASASPAFATQASSCDRVNRVMCLRRPRRGKPSAGMVTWAVVRAMGRSETGGRLTLPLQCALRGFRKVSLKLSDSVTRRSDSAARDHAKRRKRSLL